MFFIGIASWLLGAYLAKDEAVITGTIFVASSLWIKLKERSPWLGYNEFYSRIGREHQVSGNALLGSVLIITSAALVTLGVALNIPEFLKITLFTLAVQALLIGGIALAVAITILRDRRRYPFSRG
jgi:hypothetical protein